MGTLDPAKILVVLVVALVVLGPERLPQVARQIGKAWGDFRRFRQHLEEEVKGALGDGPGSPGAALAEFRETVQGTTSGLEPIEPPAGGAVPAPSTAASRDAPSTLPLPPDDPSLN